jgi:hypothetical protein
MRGEDLDVFRHGTGRPSPGGRRAGCGLARPVRYFQDFYGDDAFDWDKDVVFYPRRPHCMAVCVPDIANLTAKGPQAHSHRHHTFRSGRGIRWRPLLASAPRLSDAVTRRRSRRWTGARSLVDARRLPGEFGPRLGDGD